MYINNSLLKENIIIELSIYKNTDDNSTVIDYSFGQFAYNDYTNESLNDIIRIWDKRLFFKWSK